MSEENNKPVGDGAEGGSNQPSEDKEFVSRKAYEEVATDMHKYKRQLKEYQASLNEYQTKLKQIEEDKLKEQDRWKELYEKSTSELEAERKRNNESRSQYLRSVKMSALKQELGGKIKDVYLSHAELDKIEFKEDGSIDSESLLAVANDFRKQHSQLIPSSDNTDITSHAPKSFDSNSGAKDLKSMTMDEKVALLKQIKAN